MQPVVDPFLTDAARNRVDNTLPELTEEERDVLFDIQVYSLRLNRNVACPYSDPTDCAKGDVSSITRTITISGSKLTQQVRDTASGKSGGNCDKINVNGNLQSVASKRLVFGGGFSGKDRFCDDILPDFTVCNFRGSWDQAINLDISTVPVVRGRASDDQDEVRGAFKINIGKTRHRVDDSKCLFDLVDPDTLLGGLLSEVLIKIPANTLSAIFQTPTPDEEIGKALNTARSLTSSVAALVSRGVGNQRSFTRLMSQVEQMDSDYYVDAMGTSFIRNSIGEFDFAYAETAYFPRSQYDIACTLANAETDFIKSWSREQHTRGVKSGETLWSIAKDEYRNGELYYVVQYASNRKNPRVKVGDVVAIVPLWQIHQWFKQGRLVVPGDSMWRLFFKQNPNGQWNPSKLKVPVGSNSLDVIYPAQVLQ